MPSGAKKRKAAKKKKEMEAHINSNKPLGNDEPRSQDEKNSDGESGSPASQDNNNHQHSFDKGNGESSKTDLSPDQSVVANKSIKEGTGDALKFQRDMNANTSSTKDDSSSSSSSSTSSSSDDDSQVSQVKKDEEARNVDKPVGLGLEEVVQLTANDSLQAAKDDLFMKTSSVIDSVKAFYSEVEETIHVSEGISAETLVASDVGKLSLDKKKESLPPKLEEVSEVSSAMGDSQPRNNADNVFPICDENVGGSSGGFESAVKESDSKILPSSDAPVTESCKTVGSPKDSNIPESSEEKPHVHSVPPPMAQRTSWLSCCGLFDIVTGSG